MIIDCVFPHNITNPANLHNHLKMITGVVETGLFVNMTSKAIIGTKTGYKIIMDADSYSQLFIFLFTTYHYDIL